MLKALKLILIFSALVIVIVSFTGAYLSDSVTVSGNTFTAGAWEVPAPADVVINEFMPNPSGPEPADEWTELHNKGGTSIDVNGWVLYDLSDDHSMVISTANATGGSTQIAPGGFLVVNFQAPSQFSLNNSGGDTVRLYNGPILGGGTLVDSVIYGSASYIGKTWSAVPDGSESWSDNHGPTPGGPNV